jgi:hypothetical protein
LGTISLLVGVVVFSLGLLTHVVGFKLGDEITYESSESLKSYFRKLS